MNIVVTSILVVICLTDLASSSSPGPVPCEFAADCAADPCPAEFGNAMDENGCPLRGCPCQKAANCPALVGCDLNCPDSSLDDRPSFMRDANGCVQCECNCTNVQIVVPECNRGCTTQPFDCIFCPRGFIFNDCGNLIDCQCEGCPEIDIFGIRCGDAGRKADANGCPTNECNPLLTTTTESPIKSGSCPRRVWGRQSCKTDTDCPGREKCCRKYWWNRTKVCVKPVY